MFIHEQAAEKVRVLRREAALERALPAIWRVRLAQVLRGAAERLDSPTERKASIYFWINN